MDDDHELHIAKEYLARAQRARAKARLRYHAQLTDVLRRRGIDDAAAVAEIVIEGLFEWRDIETGERCRCSCHPRLPEADLHDYGATCGCTRTAEQRRTSYRRTINDLRQYWDSPEFHSNHAASEVAEARLQVWLAANPGVVVHSHSGLAPEQWTGEVDGHSFYFRERHNDWHIEIDLRPTGRFIHVVDSTNDGETHRRQQELKQGDVIATGTTDAQDYGTNAAERAQFIVDTIRNHLLRSHCDHRWDRLELICAAAGVNLHWCPICGSRLTTL